MARADGIKILGTGDLTKKLTVVVSAISASAKTKIEAKGGSVEIIAKKPAAPAKNISAEPEECSAPSPTPSATASKSRS